MFTAPSARAEAPGDGLDLLWTAPAECPTREQVLAHIGDLLGLHPQETTKKLEAHALIRKSDDLYELALTTSRGTGPPGTRVLSASSCGEAASAAAVIIAMALDGRAEETPMPSPTNDVEEPPTAVPTPARTTEHPELDASREEPLAPREEVPRSSSSPESVPAGPLASRSKPSFFLGAAPALDIGSLPRVAPGVSAAVGLSGGRLRLDLTALFLPPQLAEDPLTPGKGGEISLLTLGPSACWLLWGGPLAVAPCVGMELGVMQGRGYNLENGANSSGLWVAGQGGFDLVLTELEPVFVRARSSLVLPMQRYSFEFRRQDGSVATVHTPGALTARFGIFAEVAF